MLAVCFPVRNFPQELGSSWHTAEGNVNFLIRTINVLGPEPVSEGSVVQTQSPDLATPPPPPMPLPTPGARCLCLQVCALGLVVLLLEELPPAWRVRLDWGMVGPGLPVCHVNFCSFFLLSVWCLCIALSCPCQLSSLEPLWLTVPREQ